MSKDVQCPYCNHEQDINHDDGYGYDEARVHQQECRNCDKTFTFTTSISFDYEVEKADCLNGGEHKYRATMTAPRECTEMKCTMCDCRRPPTKEEWAIILTPVKP